MVSYTQINAFEHCALRVLSLYLVHEEHFRAHRVYSRP